MDEKVPVYESWAVCSNSALRRATRQLGQLYEDVFAPSGLRGTQFSLMTQIHMNGRPSLKFLADGLVMDLSALGHTLKPLIRDGLVKLEPDAKDKRVKRAMLTPAGIAKWEEGNRLWAEARDRFENAFGAEAAAELRNTLNRISSAEFAESFRR
ncbi:MarR family winged helix-turn-helix transcriptional regulator [Rhizobium sp. OAE497]|jgi:DNA-binding MarR family transcriptional regulator|uniref:MarR family winged helix-turn-helix transcriptional regulator n=1 Tax=Rhizobium sp. OAE497 TaxID=2663796 RepID=UPI0018F49E53